MNESTLPPVLHIPVGVVVDRRKAASPWVDSIWRPVAVLPGVPETAAWTALSSEPDVTTFYAGEAQIELHRSHAGFYRDNLLSGAPALWVAMHPTESDPPYALAAVTADPTEGEGYSETGTILVESVPMPDAIREIVAAFVAEHHVEREFVKRKRDRADPEAMARRAPRRGA
jgi:hypothetical protein